ncbi:ABC transporter ATP-binding protein, partial [Klebsiella oxytoca]
DHERKKFNRSSDELMEAGLTVGMRIIAMMPIMMLCMNGATLAVLYFGGRMVMGADFLLGDLNAFLSYIMQVLMRSNSSHN